MKVMAALVNHKLADPAPTEAGLSSAAKDFDLSTLVQRNPPGAFIQQVLTLYLVALSPHLQCNVLPCH